MNAVSMVMNPVIEVMGCFAATASVVNDHDKSAARAGILTRAPDPDDARKVVYRLTRKGMDLAPVLIEMVLWAARHERTDPPTAEVRAMKTDRDAVIAGLWKVWESTK